MIRSANQLKITHRTFFLIGWCYYLAMPTIMGLGELYDSIDSFDILNQYFRWSGIEWDYFLWYIFGALFLYLFGAHLTSRPSVDEKIITLKAKSFSKKFILLFLIYVILESYFVHQARDMLFLGYKSELDFKIIGALATLQMLYLFHYLYECTLQSGRSRLYVLLLITNSFLLLGMGGRLYVVSSVVAIFFRWWNWGATTRSAQLRSLLFLPIILFLAVGIGMWRVGDFDSSMFIFYLTAEANFVCISAWTQFSINSWFAVNTPAEFIYAFANIIPSSVWPEKAEWFADLINLNKNYVNPFGGVSIVASTVSNFGFIGGLLFFFVVGAYMSSIGNTRNQPARIAYYCYLVGALPFMFFRDPFQIQIKIVLMGALIYWATIFFRGRG